MLDIVLNGVDPAGFIEFAVAENVVELSGNVVVEWCFVGLLSLVLGLVLVELVQDLVVFFKFGDEVVEFLADFVFGQLDLLRDGLQLGELVEVQFLLADHIQSFLPEIEEKKHRLHVLLQLYGFNIVQ